MHEYLARIVRLTLSPTHWILFVRHRIKNLNIFQRMYEFINVFTTQTFCSFWNSISRWMSHSRSQAFNNKLFEIFGCLLCKQWLQQRLPYWADITRMSKFIRISSSFTSNGSDWFKNKLRHVLNQYNPTNRTNQNQPWRALAKFSRALYRLHVLPLNFNWFVESLACLWLARVITLVLVLLHSVENRYKNATSYKSRS